MKRSLFLKIFSGFLLIIIVLSICFFLFSFNTIKSHSIDTLANDLENLGNPILLLILPFLESKQYEELNALVKKIGENTERRITVINADGRVLADSERDSESMDNHRNREEVIKALNGTMGRTIRYSTTVKEQMLYVALPIERNERIEGVLRLSIYLRDINELLNRLKLKIFLVSTLIIAFSLIGALLFSNRIFKPIKQLISGSKRVAEGNFDSKVFLKNRDELKELADNYNFMTDQLKKFMTELSFQKEELKCIISSMEPGLLVWDKEGRITLANESLRHIIGKEPFEAKLYWEVFEESKIFELIQRVIEKKSSASDELQIDGNYYQISASYLTAMEETVLIFHDITDIRNLERIKRDFIANVSHELRTPLTAIKGYAETIEGVDKENRQYLDIIKRHTDRLISIVKDLLTLSELEKKDFELQIDDVNLNALLVNIIRMFGNRIKQKGLKVELDVEDRFPLIKGDSVKLEQVFINLMDNAIKYTEEGSITITARKENHEIAIRIEDTGIGIPEPHVPRIFERFYTVDKSHSRRLGGTGLGLSIVKHIVLLHDGSIDVESTQGRGTTFTVHLPVH